jgi:hypothetical protein
MAMPMLTSSSNNAIDFNTDFFDQATIDRLLALNPLELPPAVEELRMLPLFELPAFEAGAAEALFDAGATQTALSESLAILMEDPDYKNAIEQEGKEALMADAGGNLATQLKSSTLDSAVADNNNAARNSVQLVTDTDGVMALEVAGTRLLSVKPGMMRGPSFALIMQIAAVVLDVFALVCTAIGIAIEHGSGWVKRIAEYIKGVGQSLVDWAGKILGKVGTWFSELRSAHEGPAWMTRVKAFGKQIVNFVIESFKLGWKNRNFINSIRYCFSCLFAGPWYKKAYYLLQLIASIILMIGTAGASLAVKLVLALVQLALFIWDTIVLEQMLHPKKQSAPT